MKYLSHIEKPIAARIIDYMITKDCYTATPRELMRKLRIGRDIISYYMRGLESVGIVTKTREKTGVQAVQYYLNAEIYYKYQALRTEMSEIHQTNTTR